MKIQKERALFIAIRISLGLIFLWAFFDKLFGLGFATVAEASWLAGGSPTSGYLLYGTHGPLAGAFQALAGQVWVDWLFMMGLLGIGAGLVSGYALRFSAYAGSVLLMLMYVSAFPPEHHPFLDEHVVYTLILLFVANHKTT
jgi:thiosulfate dehydrogenase (quinone) large subunit